MLGGVRQTGLKLICPHPYEGGLSEPRHSVELGGMKSVLRQCDSTLGKVGDGSMNGTSEGQLDN